MLLVRDWPKVYCCPCLATLLAVPERQLRERAQMPVLHGQLRIKWGRCENCGRQAEVLGLTVKAT